MWNFGHKEGAAVFSASGRSVSVASLTLVAVLALVSSGCSKVGQLQGMKSFKNANQAYQQQDYPKASALYEEALKADPNLNQAYFFLGNSYDNQWKPSKKGEAGNDAFLDKAVENYQKAAEKMPTEKPEDAKLKQLALEYLVATFREDKLNDPARAEPVVQRMIQLDPANADNYFALAKIYQDAGLYDEAEKILLLAKTARPNEPAVYMQLAAFYNAQGQFDKTIVALEERASKEPNNPEAFYTISTYYWDKAYRDPRLKESDKRDMVEKGIQAVDRALAVKADYVEALVYKNLLLRLQANLEKDSSKQQALIKQADQLRDKAQELRKQKTGN
jgi:tetratricopeptide (TPR) repeat protein